jgi:hypothetical protein
MGQNVKPGRLAARWDRREKDFLFQRGEGVDRADGHLLYNSLGHVKTIGGQRTLLEELEARGYDMTTLRFSIDKRVDRR